MDAANKGRGRGRVLVIDDDPLVAASVRRVLSVENDVDSAASGGEALGLIERGPAYDVILCDLSMDGMSGSEFYDRVEARWPAIVNRITFVTGGAFTRQLQDFLARVPNPTLQKPVPLTALREFVRGRISHGDNRAPLG